MSLAVDEEKLPKSARQLLKKFEDQRGMLAAASRQLALAQGKTEQLEKEKNGAAELKNKEAEMCESLARLERELRKKKDDTYEEVKQRESAEGEARAALTQKFQQRIAEITATLETDAAEQQEVVNENKRLRQKLAHLSQEVELRAQQYEQLIKTRDVELRLSEAETEHLKELAKSDRVKSELRQQQLEEEQKEEKVLKGQLAVLTEKFGELQTTITKSNEVFKEYRMEMDKLTKRIKLLEQEKSEFLRKVASKKPTYDKLNDEVTEQLKKLEQLEKAGRAVTGLIDVLKQESKDFEEWKGACPEEFQQLAAQA